MRGIVAHCNGSVLRIVDNLELGVILCVADAGVGERAGDLDCDAVAGLEGVELWGGDTSGCGLADVVVVGVEGTMGVRGVVGAVFESRVGQSQGGQKVERVKTHVGRRYFIAKCGESSMSWIQNRGRSERVLYS